MTAKLKIRSGDTVKILSGKDRDKRGKVVGVFPREGRVQVEGLNLRKKHRRARRADRKGEVILIPMPLAASAVQLVCPACGKPTRVGYRVVGGEKHRVCKRCGKDI